MIEVTEIQILRNIKQKRESLGLDKLEGDGLRDDLVVSCSGSQDPGVRDEAERLLMKRWLLSPERDSRNAETVDLVGMIEQYDEEEREIMFENFDALQLTWGCNGDCYFCYGEPERGVKAKFSYESVVQFFQKYGDRIRKPAPLYGDDSDPFDYRDGDYGFVDVYKAFRSSESGSETDSEKFQYVSTAMPRGGQLDFIKFAKHALVEQNQNESPTLVLRISLAEHNIQRVEATLERLTGELREDGFSEEEIHDFFDKIISVETRYSTDKLGKLGRLIKDHDDFQEPESPACQDGVQITPRGVCVSLMTAANMYDASGTKRFFVGPGQALAMTPEFVQVDYYREVSGGVLEQRLDSGQIMLPPVMRAKDGELLEFDDPISTHCLMLGRDALAMTYLMESVHRVHSFSLFSDVDWYNEGRFGHVFPETFRERRPSIEHNIREAELYLEQHSDVDDDVRAQVEFFINLSEVFMRKTEFLVNFKEKGKVELRQVALMAITLRQIGRDQVGHLEQILSGLLLNDEDVENIPHGYAASEEAIREMMINRVGVYWVNEEVSEPPAWLDEIIKMHVRQVGHY